MSQSEKASYFRALKAAGVSFSKHYREYSTDELKEAYDALGDEAPELEVSQPEPKPAEQSQPVAPVARRDPNEMAGQRQAQGLQPLRTDENGLVWYQEEVLKPSYPKPRGRRVLKYMETGVRQEQVKNGDYVETFEVAGNMAERPAEVKITLPSYQVGIYKDRRFPFKIHVYNENRGFDLQEVQDFYGGAELVPAEVKRIYVENVLCYDIRTTVRAIQTEHRQLQLMGKVK